MTSIEPLDVKLSTKAAKSEQQGYWSLVWWKFRRNRMAIVGAVIIIAFYTIFCILAEFIAPYPLERTTPFVEAKPQALRWIDSSGKFHLRPFVYGLEQKIDTEKRLRYYVDNTEQMYHIYLFEQGDPYLLMGFIPGTLHLFGARNSNGDSTVFLMGTDSLGRDWFSRIIYGGRLSLLIGLIGQVITLLLGSTLGTISGYYGGVVDLIVQRITEFMAAFPDIPLFMALAAAIPGWWSPIMVYFMLTLILALVRWGGLARQVRGIVLSLREREYVLAARSAGASDKRIMVRHLLPGAMSHIIVIATLSIPGMILAETALSWLGLGLRPPLTSWGVLLNAAGTIKAIRYTPWMLWTVPFIITTVLGFNMMGDGLRDALDPYSGR